MSMETYERQLALVEVYEKLNEAEKQVAEGIPLLEGEQVFKRLREKSAKRL